ncbi:MULTISPECIES: HEPN domain-containing protein [Streptomyces]|uniref:HEPN domain-containing protein n=1 Tax=Streptomyces TaxID=1883 RepID=UPI00240E64A7|nr:MULTISPECIES: HEPN domain-containing protein [Streptomyces]WFB88935.1 HEPN domain-containing protein [Streptomyces olivaceus]WGK51104.1 HEPN domain-containing protein [Streptomyces sp. B146]
MYSGHRNVLDHLSQQQQVSHHATLQTTLPKVLLLAAASEFEERVCAALRDHVVEHTQDLKIVELVEQKAIRRQYHTLFDWDTVNAGRFWGLFGSGYKVGMKEYCRQDVELSLSIRAFLEVGSLRNRMVHNNYASFILEKTLDEVYGLYRTGGEFVQRLPELLKMSFALEEE